MDERHRHCAECSTPLAHDQRYCVRCGARRGPLPARIGLLIGEIQERGRPRTRVGADLTGPPGLPAPESPAPGPSAPGPSAPEPSAPEPLAPGPPDEGRTVVGAARAAAVAILLMLAFGCVVGSLTRPGGVESLAHAIVVAVAPPRASPVQTAAPVSDTPDRGSADDTSAAPTSPAAAPAPAAAAPAPPAQRTVTVGGPSTPAGPTTSTSSTSSSPTSLLDLPPIKHVWEIVLSSQGYQQSFATSAGHPYLATTLRRQGELISGYYGVASSPLANAIALLSGQGPTPQTIAGCSSFDDITPGTIGRLGQATGSGCVYPESAQTLPDQLAAAGLDWRAYVEGIGETVPSTPVPGATTTVGTSTSGVPGVPPSTPCPHPSFGGPDTTQTGTPDAPYVTWRNPLVYFRSVLVGGRCTGDDVGLERLSRDLRQADSTPAFSYISPSPCDDGSDTPCSSGAPTGLAQADRFLRSVVPAIERSPAYKQDGLIAITFDGAPPSGPDADQRSCCDQPTFPNLPATTTTSTPSSTSTTTTSATTSTCTSSAAGTTTTTTTTTTATTATTATTNAPAATPEPTSSTTTTADLCTPADALPPGMTPGGGQVGLLLISRYVQAGSLDQVDTFNHFSLLKSIEEIFGLKPLGYARDAALPVFDSAIFKAGR